MISLALTFFSIVNLEVVKVLLHHGMFKARETLIYHENFKVCIRCKSRLDLLASTPSSYFRDASCDGKLENGVSNFTEVEI